MRRLFTALILSGCLLWLSPAFGEDGGSASPSTAAATQQVEKKADTEDEGGMLVFWLVFAGAILFVLSSATALNSMGGKTPPRSGDATAPGKKRRTAEGKERFRL